MSKPRKLCIFCGGFPISKEHVWARWMKPYLPKNIVNHDIYIETIFPTDSVVEIKKRSGSPQSGRVRCVCEKCNTGWMSNLQEETKSILLSLMQGERTSLHRIAQTTLAKWITMFTMVAEHIDKTGTRIGVSPQDRAWLQERQSVPNNWKIWIANYERKTWAGNWSHSTLPILGEEHIPQRSELGVDLPNTQCTTIVIGKLYVHVLSSAIGRIVRKQDMLGETKRVVPRLWPIRSSPLAWPPARAIDDREAAGIASAFINRARTQRPASRPP